MSDETTLLSCPFCGGEAYFDSDNDTWECIIMARHEEWCPVSDWPKPPYDRKSVVVGDLCCCSDDRERAIAAWNTRAHGTLTAEQVRELIAPHLHARPTFDFGRHGAVWMADFQAIADELNATLGSVECEKTCYCVLEDEQDVCSECGEPWEFVQNYCPSCGGEAVKR